MKKTLLLLSMILLPLMAVAGVSFKFDSHSTVDMSQHQRVTMERNISALLSAIQDAGQRNTTLNLSGLAMEEGAKQRLVAQWEILPFVCEESEVAAKGLNDFQGFQVRGIRIQMKPKDNTYNQSVHRELTISLNRSGIITGVRPALEMQKDVSKILGDGSAVDDLTRRREILKWVEDFRNYYNERDTKSLELIYGDDALIITGSVVQKQRNTDFKRQIETSVKYVVQSKEEYINKLRAIFKKNQYINVKFDQISVVKHGAKANVYGVTLHQTWKTSTYSDEGWLFLMWDFNDPDKPQIHVRTWQPNQIVAKEGVFNLNDFFIP